MMLRSNHNTWKVTVDTLDLPPHTHLNQHVCCTLLLAAVFYRAIYSSGSCLICFVWRKVNLEIEANERHFKCSQADGSTTAELYILLALQLLSAVHSLLHHHIHLTFQPSLPGSDAASVTFVNIYLYRGVHSHLALASF